MKSRYFRIDEDTLGNRRVVEMFVTEPRVTNVYRDRELSMLFYLGRMGRVPLNCRLKHHFQMRNPE